MITYKKVIGSLQVAKQLDSQVDVVTAVNWDLVGTDSVTGAKASCPTQTAIPLTEGDFTALNLLTEEQVGQWIDDNTSEEKINGYKTIIENSINDQNQRFSSLPWQQEVTPESN